MMSIIFLLILLSFSSVVAQEYVTAELKDCERSDVQKATYCLQGNHYFQNNVRKVDVKDGLAVDESVRYCHNLLDCFDSTSHCYVGKNLEKDIKWSAATCEVFFHLEGPFAGCAKKLSEEKSKCYKRWDPLEDLKFIMKKDKKNDFCGFVFGKNNCLKNEITGICGRKQWVELRNKLIPFARIVGGCDFKSL